MPKLQESWISNGNFKLYTRSWIPDENIVATVCFIHGLGEYCARGGYEDMFNEFAANGIKVTSFDQRGFGQTVRYNGSHGISDGLSTTLKDIKLVNEAAKHHSTSNHFLMGHSMGGFLALTYASIYPDGFTGVIGSAPLVKPGSGTAPNPVEKLALSFVPSLLPTFVMPNKVDAITISRDKSEVEKYRNDPLIHGWASLQLLSDLIFESQNLLELHAKNFNLPLLIVHGTKDMLTCHQAAKEFVERIPAKDKTFKSMEGFFHELHNEPEPDRKGVIKIYIDWITTRS